MLVIVNSFYEFGGKFHCNNISEKSISKKLRLFAEFEKSVVAIHKLIVEKKMVNEEEEMRFNSGKRRDGSKKNNFLRKGSN